MKHTFLKHNFFIVTKVKADIIRITHTHSQQHPDRNIEELSRTGVRSHQVFPHGLSRENDISSPHRNCLAEMTLYPLHTENNVTPEAVTHHNQT